MGFKETNRARGLKSRFLTGLSARFGMTNFGLGARFGMTKGGVGTEFGITRITLETTTR